ncbi:hypothetical protein, partial [Tsukamurella paurometabola]
MKVVDTGVRSISLCPICRDIDLRYIPAKQPERDSLMGGVHAVVHVSAARVKPRPRTIAARVISRA